MQVKYNVQVIWLIIAGSLIIISALFPLDKSFGQSGLPSWSAPVFVGDGWWQSIAVDRAGTAHIGWYGVPGGHDSLMYVSRRLNGEWSEPVDAIYTGEGGLTVRNALGVTNYGILFAAYRDGTDHRISSAPADAAVNAGNWNVPTGIGSGYYLDMLIDNNDVIHIVSSTGMVPDLSQTSSVNLEQLPCAFCGDLLYRRSTDNGMTWSSPHNLTETERSGADRMDIWQGKSSRIYIDWDEGLDWYVGRGTALDVRLMYSEDEGQTWSEPVILDGGGLANSRPIQIAATELDGEGLLAVWRYATDDDRRIYYQISDDLGHTWTHPEPIPGILARELNETPLDDYELVTDIAGVAHFFGAGVSDVTPQANTSLFHIEFRQGQWWHPSRVFEGTELTWPEWPKAAIGPQNEIHLAWFNRIDWYNSNMRESQLQVYYALRSGTLPDRQPAGFIPTATPGPTEVVLPEFQATATPFPTVAPMDANLSVRVNQDRYATETLLGALFVSMVFCGSVFVIQRFFRHK